MEDHHDTEAWRVAGYHGPDEARVLRQAWEAVGMFSHCEAQVDDITDWYLRDVPKALLKVVRKRRLSDDERRQVLVAVLGHHALEALYPDLPQQYARIAQLRNQLAHADPMWLPRGSRTLTGEPLPTGLSVQSPGEWSDDAIWPPAKVAALLEDAKRLTGLLETLKYELGITTLALVVVLDPPSRLGMLRVSPEIAVGARQNAPPREPYDFMANAEKAKARYDAAHPGHGYVWDR